MKRLILATATTFFVAACGSAASAGTTQASPSPSGANAFRGGAAGQLVQINPQTLIISGPNGDTTITYTSSTTVTKTRTAALTDITLGSCVAITGRKDVSGAVTATAVRLSPKPASGCAAPRVAPSPGPGASPRPSFSPRPGAANLAVVAGEVTGVSGTSVTVLSLTGTSQTITVPAAATVITTSAASLTDLQTGQCLSAAGPRDASGNVQANSLTITPAGPSGTCATRVGRGGGGGLGGGGLGGGGGGGLAPPSGA
jgi:hypothetical protein